MVKQVDKTPQAKAGTKANTKADVKVKATAKKGTKKSGQSAANSKASIEVTSKTTAKVGSSSLKGEGKPLKRHITAMSTTTSTATFVFGALVLLVGAGFVLSYPTGGHTGQNQGNFLKGVIAQFSEAAGQNTQIELLPKTTDPNREHQSVVARENSAKVEVVALEGPKIAEIQLYDETVEKALQDNKSTKTALKELEAAHAALKATFEVQQQMLRAVLQKQEEQRLAFIAALADVKKGLTQVQQERSSSFTTEAQTALKDLERRQKALIFMRAWQKGALKVADVALWQKEFAARYPEKALQKGDNAPKVDRLKEDQLKEGQLEVIQTLQALQESLERYGNITEAQLQKKAYLLLGSSKGVEEKFSESTEEPKSFESPSVGSTADPAAGPTANSSINSIKERIFAVLGKLITFEKIDNAPQKEEAAYVDVLKALVGGNTGLFWQSILTPALTEGLAPKHPFKKFQELAHVYHMQEKLLEALIL